MPTGSDFGLFLKALASGKVYYDPGIKVEGVGTLRERPHRRSQFRTSFRELPNVYHGFESVEV